MLVDLSKIEGWNDLSPSFCNQPVRISSAWPFNDEPVAVVYLCGRNSDHDGECDPIPPLSDLV